VKAFAMLQSFKNPDEWVSARELCRRAKLPVASGYRILCTLEGVGAVVHGDAGGYRPGKMLKGLSGKRRKSLN
jgi:DNA-binding IclR family transcriptional regulator